MRSVLTIGILSSTIAACREGSTATDTFDRLVQLCPNGCQPCWRRLSDATTFAWDRVLFLPRQTGTSFGGGQDAYRAAVRAIGLDSLVRKEFEDVVVYVDGGREVARHVRSYEPETPYDRTYFMADTLDGSGWYWKVFGPSDVFRIDRDIVSGK